MFDLKTLPHVLFCTQLFVMVLMGCAPSDRDEDAVVLLWDKKSRVPLSTVRLAYANSALRGFLPLDAQLTPARALYNLLETANARDAMKWVVASDNPAKGPQNPLYSGYIEVFSPFQDRGAECRKFTQELCFHEVPEQIIKTQTTGMACKRYPGSWVIVEERQYDY